MRTTRVARAGRYWKIFSDDRARRADHILAVYDSSYARLLGERLQVPRRR